MRYLVCLSLLLGVAEGFRFTLPARGFKCFHEELPHNYNYEGKWSATAGYSQFIDTRITDPHGTIILEEKGKDSSDFFLTTAMAGDHTICFYNRLVQGVPFQAHMNREITFQLLEGAQAQDYDQIAKIEHLKPIEVNLRMMEDTVKAIHAEYQYFKEREFDMRDTSESTNSRAMWITLTSMVSFFLFGVWQVSHMKKYFREKKLI
ncbi:Transmembrane emp24 domain-containing protein bai [Diplonema papillatum]|nr:Transmembrane emp24 domain-containing protein bai [Diplonema papillatum]